MAGIQDMLTDIRTTGQGVPMGGQPPMGGPPPGMGGGQPPMPEQGMGEMAMQGQPMEEEAPMDPQQDSAMLAEAVVGRKLETTGYEILKTVHPHPTMSEAVMEAVAAAYDEVIHL